MNIKDIYSCIRNIRVGLATNSSSTHSIIHNPDLQTEDDKVDGYNFGWSFFTAASREAKEAYLDLCLFDAVSYSDQQILKYLIDEYAKDSKLEQLSAGYVDHESRIHFPKCSLRYDADINLEFFKEFRDYITNGSFFILGGNDNTEDSHHLSDDDDGHYSGMHENFYNKVAYKNGNYWTLFSKKSKLRIKFSDGDLVPHIPELIDLKITDYCDMGCSFCYQNSTKQGKHSYLKNIKGLVTLLPANVEYAVGGGEPTSHPEFPEILKVLACGDYSNTVNRLVNFTTKSTKWFKNSTVVDAVNKYVSGVAYSITNASELDLFYELHCKHIKTVAMYIHIIPDMLSMDEICAILDWADTKSHWQSENRVAVTMLGYKNIGRATTNLPTHSDLSRIFDSRRKAQIGVDTKFMNDYFGLIPQKIIDSKLYTIHEGEFSMYIDASEEVPVAYKSSYDLDNPIPLFLERTKTQKRSDILDIFGTIRKSGGFTTYEDIA